MVIDGHTFAGMLVSAANALDNNKTAINAQIILFFIKFPHSICADDFYVAYIQPLCSLLFFTKSSRVQPISANFASTFII